MLASSLEQELGQQQEWLDPAGSRGLPLERYTHNWWTWEDWCRWEDSEQQSQRFRAARAAGNSYTGSQHCRGAPFAWDWTAIAMSARESFAVKRNTCINGMLYVFIL